ncbi:hypothetical protein L1987_64339 [Smallanthus sonchifolius]|uniref:Uncharacterized protein n=1 Tax=Smallanthus sonchifolius TaxID=185202 RepID=A0ACB9CFV4_9ASTR|nr:hypothetical protein L1987_64339 [Smallanthus sonchifolius]
MSCSSEKVGNLAKYEFCRKLKLSGNLIPRGTRRTGIGSLAVREGQGFRRCFEGSPRGTRELAGKSLAVRERPGFRACFWDSLAVREGGGQNASRNGHSTKPNSGSTAVILCGQNHSC